MLHREERRALASQKQAGGRAIGCQASGPDGICWSRLSGSPMGLMEEQTEVWKPEGGRLS